MTDCDYDGIGDGLKRVPPKRWKKQPISAILAKLQQSRFISSSCRADQSEEDDFDNSNDFEEAATWGDRRDDFDRML